jgi:sporulation protein YlmC with PRC-barrel domain
MYGKRSFTLMVAALGAMLLSSAWAQETQQREQAQERARQRAQQATGAQAGQGQVCLASKLQEMTVKDQAGQEFGKIQDLVIDSQGQVRYLAIAKQAGGQQAAQPQAGQRRPGAEEPEERAQQQAQQPAARGQHQAGQAGQLTLIPWEVAQIHEGTTPQQSYVTLKIEAERLQQAPTFTAQQLTSKEGQQQWMAQVNQFFGQLRGAARPEFDRERRQEQPEQRQQQPNPQRDN